MAELRVMDALREKRSELSGVVSRLEQQLAQHRGSLAHLDATMRLFDPDLLSQDANPAPQWERVSWFRPGECRRLIYDVLLLEFFTAQINSDHTRKAYLNATRRFADWCAAHGLYQLDQVQAFHVAAFVKHLQGQFTPPTVKQHLAALRMLFDWLVTGHVTAANPAHAVRGPKYVMKKGKTPMLQADEACALLAAIDTGPLIGLRDRALIGTMVVYTFARVNAVLAMRVKDYFIQGRRGWVRLHEKGGKEHEVPCHHTLE